MQGDEYGYTDAGAGDSDASPEAGSAPVSPAEGTVPSVEAAAEPVTEAPASPAVPSFTPQSAPGSLTTFYQIVAEDTSLGMIASKLHLSSPYHEIFQPNMATLDIAARAAGYPGGSDQGTILIPGTWLEVRLPAQSAPS